MKRTRSASTLSCALAAVIAPLAMVGVTLLILRRLAAGRVLAGGDLHIYFFPYWVKIAHAVQALQFPFWTKDIFVGAPLAANSQLGVFYPLNWLFWVLSGGEPQGVARAIHVSVLLHVSLAALNVYLLGRRSGYAPWPAAVAGTIYAGSGFVGIHVDHLNQLQAMAWLPLLFLGARDTQASDDTPLRCCGPTTPVAAIAAYLMILLTGHLQMAFVAGLGVAVHLAVVTWLGPNTGPRLRARSAPVVKAVGQDVAADWVLRASMSRRLGSWLGALIPFAIAGLVAGVQLLPTLQLAGLSGRSGGLPWREAVSFSVSPWHLPSAVLPPYLAPLKLPEGVAYTGLLALLLAAIGGTVSALGLERRRELGLAWLVLGVSGLFLALGAHNPLYLAAVRARIPGFVHFRAPARFLALYVLAVAMMGGAGLEYTVSRIPWVWRRQPEGKGRRPFREALASPVPSLVAIAVVGVELLVAAEHLPHADATTSRAYTSFRPAAAQLYAAARRAEAAGDAPGRFLSISQMLFEVGDKAEATAIYDSHLSSDALWAYLVSSKQREILTPNLSLAFGVPATDGYDGGLLPLRSFIRFSELLIPGGSQDGRLRENLSIVPDDRWLDLLGVRYVLTDKTADTWIDDVFYDRQFQPVLTKGEALEPNDLPGGFEADALGILYEGSGVTLSLELADGRRIERRLPVSLAALATRWVRWSGSAQVVAVRFLADAGTVRIAGASLLDARTNAFHPLVLSERLRLVHSGDVKIYEADPAPPLSWLVASCVPAESGEDGLAHLARPGFDPYTSVVLESRDGVTPDLCSHTPRPISVVGDIEMVSHRDEEVVLDVTADASAYLVLAETWYPGWRAWVQPLGAANVAPIELPLYRANLMQRAVPVQAGRWRVTFRYVPTIYNLGALVTVVGCVVLVIYALRGATFARVRAACRDVAEC